MPFIDFYTQRGCKFCSKFYRTMIEKYRDLPMGFKPRFIDVDKDHRGLYVDSLSQGIVPTVVFSSLEQEELFSDTFINVKSKIIIRGAADERTNRQAIEGIIQRL